MYFDQQIINKVTKISQKLIKNKLTITFVESCTGGLMSAIFTEIAGASQFLNCSIVTYSNEAKITLANVKSSTIENHGAVSSQAASEMAVGSLDKSKSDIALSITGIAGPTGATPTKPIGLVYIAIATNDKVEVKKFNFSGDRSQIRLQTIKSALDIIESTINMIENY